ncbi:Rhodopsin kinase [Cytospora mali]|uniref:non-specific serine/threonine protein kinase n=1 Tax=Cytospora mali TaxID=578113 RepID=A0A194WAE1_CYTMA|nr:Rhodopsin kinase [Valsa mali]
MDQSRSDIIQANPIGKHLDGFRASFKLVCEEKTISCTPDALDQLGREDLQNLSIGVILALLAVPASRLLRSSSGGKNLFNDLSRLNSSINSDEVDFDFDCILPLLKAVLAKKPDNEIWTKVYNAVTESTPPPRPVASSVQQTPWLHNTGSFVNTSEYRKYMDDILKEELGLMYVGIPGFSKAFFGGIAELEPVSKAVFDKCSEGPNPLYRGGWIGWPLDANEEAVLSWLQDLIEKLAVLAGTKTYRRPLAQPNTPIQGSTATRKIDICFVSDPEAEKETPRGRYHWSQILIPGELKSNPSQDISSKTWLDLGRYAREVFAAQDTRRFVLGFTICGSLMRLWEFDRLGGIASEQFDVNKDGLQFVSTILAFLWMDKQQLGFDPTVTTIKGQRFIDINREGRTERFIIDRLIRRAPCIAGRATTCWKARLENTTTQFVIKDSWQYTERDEEGELLQDATKKGVVNLARYYHHETVQVFNQDDDIRSNVHKGLDITKAKNYPSKSSVSSAPGALRRGRTNTAAGVKRSSSQTGATMPPSKRVHSDSSVKLTNELPLNRVHRRIILRDYGKPIYTASSPSALLAALEGCIEGHESLHNAGLLHRDISINNLMINEDEKNPSWTSFLIDLDLAIKEPREGTSGVKGLTGTRAFMAIGILLGEQHSFMHDLESFFWVLFWICIHYDGPYKGGVVPRFEKWNYINAVELASLKKGVISDENDFLKMAEDNFTPYYSSLTPWVNRLRRRIFPNGQRWHKPNAGLYSSIKEILREAQKDQDVVE